MGQHRDVEAVQRTHPRSTRATGQALLDGIVQDLVVVRHKNANSDGRTDKEDCQTHIHCLERLRNNLTWVACLACNN